jgi:hypothetical protein
MISWFQSQLTSLISFVIMLACILLALIGGIRFGGGNKVLSWAIGIGILIVLVIFTSPITESLDRTACGLNVDKCY